MEYSIDSTADGHMLRDVCVHELEGAVGAEEVGDVPGCSRQKLSRQTTS